MKKTILLLLLFLAFSQINHAQIGILGTALNGYNAPDIPLSQISQFEHVLQNQTFTNGTVKFRLNNSWTTNWGNTNFPVGEGYQDGPDIPVPAGTYNIYFKSNTGFYDFFAHDNIGITGTAVSSNGFSGDDLKLFTVDNIHFEIHHTFLAGEMKIRKDNDWAVNWGFSDFPSGTGVQDGINITVPAGDYYFYFNKLSGEYTFSSQPAYPTINMIGTAIPGGNFTSPDVPMTTTDGNTYTLSNYSFTTGELKFREGHSWALNWGNTNFPMGTAVQNGSNIQVPAGTYDVTFDRINGTYTFIGTPFPTIGIWGPAVNSQLGYTAPDVKMTTIDGVIYTLSGFYFSSGNAYFRQDDTSSLVFGSTTFPTGTAVSNGPSLFIPGGEWFVTFNRTTGQYSFEYPKISILGTAVIDWNTDVDMQTNDGFNYFLNFPQGFSTGSLKFRKDHSWNTNWGGNTFPSGVGVLNGNDIVISPNVTGFDYATFERTSGNYSFIGILSNTSFYGNSIFSYYPNPTNNNWNFNSQETIESIEILDVLGKTVQKTFGNANNLIVDASELHSGIYFAKITIANTTQTVKLIKN